MRVSFRPAQVLFLWDLSDRTVCLHKKFNGESERYYQKQGNTNNWLNLKHNLVCVVLLKKTWVFFVRMI